MSIILALAYVFRQITMYLSDIYGTTLAGNLDPFYFFAILFLFSNKKTMQIKKIILWGLVLMVSYFLIQTCFVDIVSVPKVVINILKISVCMMIMFYVKANYQIFNFKNIAIYISYIYGMLMIIALVFKESILWRHGDIVNKYNSVRLQFFYLEPSELGYHVMIIIIFLIWFLMKAKSNQERVKLIICLGINVFVLAMARPMGAISFGAVAVAGMIIYDWVYNFTKKKNYIYLSLAVVSVVLTIYLFVSGNSIALRIIDTFNGKDGSNWYRITVSFNVLVQSLKDTHLLGVGFGNLNTDAFRSNYYEFGFYKVLANSFIYYLVETGIFGVITLITMLGVLIKSCYKKGNALKVGIFVFIISYQVLASHFTNGLNWFLYGIILSSYGSMVKYKGEISKIRLTFLHAGAELYGADKVMLSLIKNMDKSKFDINVILPNNGPLVDKITEVGVSVDVVEYPILRRKFFNPKGIILYVYEYIIYSIKLSKRIRRDETEILHVNTTAVLEGIFLKSFTNVQMVWHVHEILVSPKKLAKIIYTLVSVFSDQVVVVSTAVQDAMKISYKKPKSIKTIYNGIENDNFYSEKKNKNLLNQLGIAEEDKVVGMVGRINAWKGQEDFVKSVIPALKKMDNLKVLIIGSAFEGEEWRVEELKEVISKTEFENKFILLDFQHDIQLFYNLMDLFVLPSTNPDPLPTVILEAMACGLPIVAYEHGGVCEMTENGKNSILVEVHNVEALGSAIGLLLNNESLRKQYSQNSIKRQKEFFSMEAYVNNFTKLYHDLLEEA